MGDLFRDSVMIGCNDMKKTFIYIIRQKAHVTLLPKEKRQYPDNHDMSNIFAER